MTGIMWGLSWDIRRLAAGYLEAILGLCNIAEPELDKVLSLDCYKQLFTFVPRHTLSSKNSLNAKLQMKSIYLGMFSRLSKDKKEIVFSLFMQMQFNRGDTTGYDLTFSRCFSRSCWLWSREPTIILYARILAQSIAQHQICNECPTARQLYVRSSPRITAQ